MALGLQEHNGRLRHEKMCPKNKEKRDSGREREGKDGEGEGESEVGSTDQVNMGSLDPKHADFYLFSLNSVYVLFNLCSCLF